MIIALCGQKGGAGKTTVTTNVIAELLARGRRVLLIDADGQGSARTWADKAARAGLPAPAIALVPGVPLTSGERTSTYDEAAVAAWLVRDARTLAADFDDTLIDCPGRVTAGLSVQHAALSLADIAIIPAADDAFSAWSLAATADLIRDVQEGRPALLALGLVTRVDRRRSISEQAREHVAKAGLRALDVEIRDRAEYVEAPGFLLGVSTYKPRSRAADEIRGLVDELQRNWRRHGKEKAAERGARKAPGAHVRQP